MYLHSPGQPKMLAKQKVYTVPEPCSVIFMGDKFSWPKRAAKCWIE